MKNFSEGIASSTGDFDSSQWLKSFDSIHQYDSFFLQMISLGWDKCLFIYCESLNQSLNHWVIHNQNESCYALLNFMYSSQLKDEKIAFKHNKLFLDQRK